MHEVWKRLIYQGIDYGDYYEVSNYGQIRNSKTKKIRKQNLLKTGYCFVNGSLGSRENKITFRVHKAVAETFIPNPNNLPEVNHKNGDKLKNDVDNLEWCTHVDNIKHAYSSDLIKCGVSMPTSKLTDDIVKYAREKYIPYDKKYGIAALAKEFGVDPVTMRYAIHGKTWKHVI